MQLTDLMNSELHGNIMEVILGKARYAICNLVGKLCGHIAKFECLTCRRIRNLRGMWVSFNFKGEDLIFRRMRMFR